MQVLFKQPKLYLSFEVVNGTQKQDIFSRINVSC